MAGKGGGAWKVAYADFVTAMMAFFMVMWLVAQGEDVKEAVAGYFRDPRGLYASGGALLPAGAGEHSEEAPPPKAGKKGPESESNSGAKRRGSATAGVGREDRSGLGSVIPFAGDTAELPAPSKEKLEKLVPLLVGIPQKIELRGHASGQPLSPNSPYSDQWQLCYARCVETMKFLEQHGIEPERMRLSQAGPFEPFTIGSDPDRVQYNSSVEILVLAEAASNLQGTADERKHRFTSQ